jgi:CRISPR system Cascade subunit CasD
MREFLLFRLHGLLASWGEIAVGERRGSWSRPSKSAVLGLVAAALGIERHEGERLGALAAGYGFAVRVDSPGVSLRDYHTVQTVREANIRKLRKTSARPLTRRRELSVDDPETILSQRDYYTDALYTAALWARESPPVPIGEIRDALLRPRFVLYLGRKSCPPSLPLAPEIASAEHLLAALAAYRPPTLPGLDLAQLLNRRGDPMLLAWEDAVVPEEVARRLHVEHRRDAPGDRQRWHFAERDEQVAILP